MDEFVAIGNNKALVPVAGQMVLHSIAKDLGDTQEMEKEANEIEARVNQLELQKAELTDALETFVRAKRAHPDFRGRTQQNDNLKAQIKIMEEEAMRLQLQMLADSETGGKDEPVVGEHRPDSEDEEDGSAEGVMEDEEDEAVGLEDLTPDEIYKYEEELKKFRGRRDVSRDCKNLFKKIAAKTHPDRTADTEMHDLFRAARVLAEVNDYRGLVEVWAILKTGRSPRRARAEARLLLMQNKAYKVSREVQLLLGSDANRLLQLEVTGYPDHAHSMFGRLLEAERNRLAEHHEALRNELSRMKGKINRGDK